LPDAPRADGSSGGGELSANGKDYVAAILASSARLGEQIESLLDLSQSEAGLLPLAREEFALLPFARELVDQRAQQIEEAGLSLDLQADEDVGTIEGDRRRLSRAIGHLIDNSIAATPEGGRILLQLSRANSGDKHAVRVVVSDNGGGMDETELANALDGIKVGDDALGAMRRQGIGLPLVRQLIEAHGGTFDLHSEPGKGTAAIVHLP